MLLSGVIASAQVKERNLDLDELVVTGQYEVNSLSKSVQKVKVIDAKRIEQQGAFTLQHVLTNELNIRIIQDPILGSGIQLQGIGGNNIKILVDGVPVVGRENGSIDLSQINLANVERIEFVEGPMSVNYGTDALGGVINIITKKQQAEKKNFRFGSYAESIGQYNYDLNANYSKAKYGAQASFGRNFFKGFSEDPNSRMKLWKPRTQYNAELSLSKFINNGSLRWTNQYFQEKVTDRGEPTIDWTQATALDRYYYTNRFSSSFFFEKKHDGKRNMNVLASYNFYERRFNTYYKDLVQQTEQIVPSTSENDSSRFHQLMSRGTYANVAFSKKMNYQMGYEVNQELAIGERIEGERQYMADYNVFASAELKPINRLLVRPAFRAIYHSKFSAPFVPSIHLKYDLSESTVMRASYARGFRAPSLKELYLQFVDASHNLKGNTNLSSETSNNIQIGLTYTYKLESRVFRFEPNLFYNKINGLIELARTGSGNTVSYQYVNINSYSSTGISISTEYRTIPYSITFGYSYTGRKNEIDGYQMTESFYFSHEYRVNGSYTVKNIGTTFNVFCKANGRVQIYQFDYLNDNVSLNFIDPFVLLDLTAGKEFLNKKLSVTVGVKNILNVINVNASISSNPHSGGSSAAATGMGRTGFIGIKYHI